MSEDRMPNRRNLTTWGVPIIAVATAASLAALAADESSPAGNGGRTIVAESRFDVTNPAQQVQLVQLVVDFPPGAWTSWHKHGGQATNLVLEGEITLRHAGMEHPYRAGQAWTDSSGQVHAAGNAGPGKARLLTNNGAGRRRPSLAGFVDLQLRSDFVCDFTLQDDVRDEAGERAFGVPGGTEIDHLLHDLRSGG